MPGPTKYGGQTVTIEEKLQIEAQPINEFLKFVPDGDGFTMKYKFPEEGAFTPEGSDGPVTFKIRENLNLFGKCLANLITGGQKPFAYSQSTEDKMSNLKMALNLNEEDYDLDSAIEMLGVPEDKSAEFRIFLEALGPSAYAIASEYDQHIERMTTYQNLMNAYVAHPGEKSFEKVEGMLEGSYADYQRELDDIQRLASIDPEKEEDIFLRMDCEISGNLNERLAKFVNDKRVAEHKKPIPEAKAHAIIFDAQKDSDTKTKAFMDHVCFTSTVRLGAEDKVLSIEMTAPPSDKIFFRDEKGIAATGIFDTLEDLDQYHTDRNMVDMSEAERDLLGDIVARHFYPEDAKGNQLVQRVPKEGLSLTGSDEFTVSKEQPQADETISPKVSSTTVGDYQKIPNPNSNLTEFIHDLATGPDYPLLCDQIVGLTGTDSDAASIAINDEKSDVRVYDSELNPIDFSDRHGLQFNMMKGMYVFKKDEAEPHLLTFDDTGSLLYSNKTVSLPEAPKPVPRPGRITRFFDSIAKTFGGKGFASCNNYDKYVRENEHYNKLQGIMVERSKQKMAKEQSVHSRDTIKSEYSKAQDTYTMLSQKEGLSEAVKECFKQGARGFEKIGTSQNYRTFADSHDTSLARIALASALVREQTARAANPEVTPRIENLLKESGYENALKAFNRLPSIEAAKENLTPTLLRRTVTSQGAYISQNAAEDFKKVQVTKQNQPERQVSGPAK